MEWLSRYIYISALEWVKCLKIILKLLRRQAALLVSYLLSKIYLSYEVVT